MTEHFVRHFVIIVEADESDSFIQTSDKLFDCIKKGMSVDGIRAFGMHPQDDPNDPTKYYERTMVLRTPSEMEFHRAATSGQCDQPSFSTHPPADARNTAPTA